MKPRSTVAVLLIFVLSPISTLACNAYPAFSGGAPGPRFGWGERPDPDAPEPWEEPFHPEGPFEGSSHGEPEPWEEPFRPEEPFVEEDYQSEIPYEEPWIMEPQPEDHAIGGSCMPELECTQPGSNITGPSIDLAITDIYPDHLPHGTLWGRITNNGPGVITGMNVGISCYGLGRQRGNPLNTVEVSMDKPIFVSLSPGQTQNFNTGMKIDANLYQYDVACGMDFQLDPTPSNDLYNEMVPKN